VSSLALSVVAIAHALACVDFGAQGQYPMAAVMFGFFLSDLGMVWYSWVLP
jgi:hypothetical protein